MNSRFKKVGVALTLLTAATFAPIVPTQNGLISVAACRNNGVVSYQKIPDEQYKKMGEPGGSILNPSKASGCSQFLYAVQIPYDDQFASYRDLHGRHLDRVVPTYSDDYDSFSSAANVLVPKAKAAIAFDAGGSSNTTGTSLTYAHTVTGSNTILFLHAFGTSNVITGATYNGVSMTQIAVANATGQSVHMFDLVNPATGSNNIVISASGSTSLFGRSASYTGAVQTGQPDNFNTNTGTGSSASVAVTVGGSDCWTATSASNNADNWNDPGTNFRRTAPGLASSIVIGDSNGVVGPGSVTMTLTPASGTPDWALITASFCATTPTTATVKVPDIGPLF